ncbi:MAG: DUF2029 domain-containing protein, partial [Gemmataceae bacterium]|nr:DUF2029 domain-containing protein [Gemmataceae bacterium]
DLAKIKEAVAGQYPHDKNFIENCGYYLPPHANLLFVPFALAPPPVAKVAWALLHGLAGLMIASLQRLLRRPDEPPPAGLIAHLVPFLLLFNFLAVAVLMVGQFSQLFVACIVGGLWCFDRGGKWGAAAGVLLWSCAFVKPHIAIPFIGLAWYLGGWKRAAALVGMVGGLNLLGAAVIGGSPLFLRDYFEYLRDAHQHVEYNRAELNPEITSWNRLLFVLSGEDYRFLIEQTAVTVVASYLVWFGLLLGRCGLSGVKPPAAWALAAAAAGAVVCPQVLGYEAILLLLAVPWIGQLFADRRRAWGAAAVLLLGMQAIPYQGMDSFGFHFHRPLCAMLFALLVLAGPTGSRADD